MPSNARELTKKPDVSPAHSYDGREPGVYAFRTIFEADSNGASIEWKLRKANGSEILLDDIAGGGFARINIGKPAKSGFVKGILPRPRVPNTGDWQQISLHVS